MSVYVGLGILLAIGAIYWRYQAIQERARRAARSARLFELEQEGKKLRTELNEGIIKMNKSRRKYEEARKRFIKKHGGTDDNDPPPTTS